MPTSADQQPERRDTQSPSTSDRSHSDLYLASLSPENREAYQVASPEVDLSTEIRLMRAVLSQLAEHIPANHRHMTLVLGVLIRAVSLQSKRLGSASDVERALLEAAEQALRRAQEE